MTAFWPGSDMTSGATLTVMCKAHDTRTRNSCELARARNLYVCRTNLQQDISLASFSHQIERVLYCASFSYEFHASVMGLRLRNDVIGL